MLNRTYMTMLYNEEMYKVYFVVRELDIIIRVYLEDENVDNFKTSVPFDIDFIMEIVLDRLEAVIGGI